MRDHPSSHLITTRKPLPTPPATSIIILTPQQPSTKTPIAGSETTTSESQYPKNPMFDVNEHKHQYAMDMDIAYGYPGLPHNPQSEVFDVTNSHKSYLSGPSVVRVKPDGSPVEEDRNKPLAKDDDLEHFVAPLSYVRQEDDVKVHANSNAKHRRIATINALKQQYLTNLAMQQQELLPPFEDGRGGRNQRQAFAFNYERARV